MYRWLVVICTARTYQGHTSSSKLTSFNKRTIKQEWVAYKQHLHYQNVRQITINTHNEDRIYCANNKIENIRILTYQMTHRFDYQRKSLQTIF